MFEQTEKETLAAKVRKFVPSRKVIITAVTVFTVGAAVVVANRLGSINAIEAGAISEPPFDV